MSEILIGTSGYYYQDWLGNFYPEDMRKENFLDYYSSRFPFCELNFSYYQMPKRSNLIKLARQTPQGFQFTVKAHQSITHGRGRDWERQAEDFFHALTPLSDEGKLSAVLLQFPYSFHYQPANRKYLSDVLSVLDGLPLCIEFRNREWMKESVYGGLEKRKVCFVQTDLPALDNLPIPTSTTTSNLGYVRFHGRNNENWWTGDNTSRFDYLYDDHELHSWLCRIEDIASKVSRLLIAFNNHHKGKAVRNAQQFYRMITEHTDLKPEQLEL